MFPVPSHLPRTGGDHLASPPNDRTGGDHLASPPNEVETTPTAVEVDTVLDLFEPLLRDGQSLDSKTVRGVRGSLEAAIIQNKGTAHGILKANYPSISSHIRDGSQITADFGSIQTSLNELESKLDPENKETSFIPPLIALSRRHFNAVQAQSQASARASALKELKKRTEGLKRLEEGVYGARGADEAVVAELEDGNVSVEEALEQSEVMKTIKARMELLKGLLVEQVVEGYKQAVSFTEDKNGQFSIVVQKTVKLQKPPNTRTTATRAGDSPAYSLEDLYIALSRLQALSDPIRQLQTQVVKELVGPILSGTCTVKEESGDNSQTLRLVSTTQRTSSDILADLSTLFSFIDSTVFPPIPPTTETRNPFLAGLHSSTSELLLSTLIIPAIPTSLDDLPVWLDTVKSAADFESSTGTQDVKLNSVRAFYDDRAGLAWANLRRSRIGDQVRRLIISGWEGWEAVSISRDKEISVVVEVEVEDEEPEDVKMDIPRTQDEPESATTSTSETKVDSATDDEEGGWEFEEQSPQAEAGPSSPRRTSTEEADDGWAFDDDLSAPAPAPVPIKAPKPTREAKKLGKKVAKAKTSENQDSGMDSTEMSRSSSFSMSTPPHMPSPKPTLEAEPQAGGMDWEAWDDEPKKEPVKSKIKRKILKDEKRVIKETFLVSKACDTLLELAEQVLRDARSISNSPPAPSFTLAPALLYTTTTDIFDLYRSLIRSHFDAQLQSVPTLSMQVYNDSIHLSDRVDRLSRQYETWQSSDVCRRLREFGEGCFERDLERQRDSLVNTLDGIEWYRGVEGFKRSAGIPGQVKADLENLSRMFQTVLPTTTYLSVMGYLVNVAISNVTDAILAQQDITEEESNHLNELLRTLHPLEDLFILEPGQPSSVVEHVHGWLKFCYLSELLSANLVDITYLFENGALIDFTADELISLLKALFADSEKREKAIERIERGL